MKYRVIYLERPDGSGCIPPTTYIDRVSDLFRLRPLFGFPCLATIAPVNNPEAVKHYRIMDSAVRRIG